MRPEHSSSLQSTDQHSELIEIRGACRRARHTSGGYDNLEYDRTHNGRHVGVNVDGLVFDNLHPNGRLSRNGFELAA
ncbi:MAG: hypothetical protein U0736_02965 [Gemmataceae bacterium]